MKNKQVTEKKKAILAWVNSIEDTFFHSDLEKRSACCIS